MRPNPPTPWLAGLIGWAFLLPAPAAALQEPPPPAAEPPAARPSVPARNAQDGLAAIVGRVRITLLDLRAELNRLIPLNFFHNKLPADRVAQMQAQALDHLVERALILQDAQDRKLTASEEEIRAEFAETLKKAGPQYSGLAGEEVDALRARYHDLIVRRILLDKNEARFEAGLAAVAPERVRALYDERAEQLLAPLEAHFLHLLVKVPPSASQAQADEIRARTEGLLAQLQDGASFELLARENSEDIYALVGGDMGFVTLESFLNPGIGAAAFALRDGETSGVLPSMYGCHIVRRVESKPRRRLTFEQARPALAAELAGERRAAARAQWLEGLRAHYGVEILVELEPAAPAAPAAPTGAGDGGARGAGRGHAAAGATTPPEDLRSRRRSWDVVAQAPRTVCRSRAAAGARKLTRAERWRASAAAITASSSTR